MLVAPRHPPDPPAPGRGGGLRAAAARCAAAPLLAIAGLAAPPDPATPEPPAAVYVSLDLYDGSAVVGRVGGQDADGLLLEVEGRVLALGWDRIRTSSAYQARRKILAAARGSAANLTAEDHYQLGYFLAARNRHAAAAREFREAQRRNPQLQERIQRAWRQIRQAKEQNRRRIREPLYAGGREAAGGTLPVGSGSGTRRFSEEQHRVAVAGYRRFGERVREQVTPDLVLLETRHFLVWTDWPERSRNLIPDWAEQMYDVLCDQFGFPKEDPIWLGKCPIFCFRNRARFEQFARQIDHHDPQGMLGYTKTLDNGYAHVVLRRLGTRPEDIDRFAVTMVHEASHAFVHAFRSPRSLPRWLNEGLADYIAERVLNDRCHTGEDATAVARHLALAGTPIGELFKFQECPPGYYYPIAHSVVRFLIREDRAAFAAMIRDLKDGIPPGQALARSYRGMTYEGLERSWRSAIRSQSAQ